MSCQEQSNPAGSKLPSTNRDIHVLETAEELFLENGYYIGPIFTGYRRIKRAETSQGVMLTGVKMGHILPYVEEEVIKASAAEKEVESVMLNRMDWAHFGVGDRDVVLLHFRLAEREVPMFRGDERMGKGDVFVVHRRRRGQHASSL